jgi:hypothetical protein
VQRVKKTKSTSILTREHLKNARVDYPWRIWHMVHVEKKLIESENRSGDNIYRISTLCIRL